MTIGEVLRTARTRRAIPAAEMASRVGLTLEEYAPLEADATSLERSAMTLADLAVHLKIPLSRLVSPTGRADGAAQTAGQCGRLVQARRETLGLDLDQLAALVGTTVTALREIESGASAVERDGPTLLRCAEAVEEPVFNLVFPCGLPLSVLETYP